MKIINLKDRLNKNDCTRIIEENKKVLDNYRAELAKSEKNYKLSCDWFAKRRKYKNKSVASNNSVVDLNQRNIDVTLTAYPSFLSRDFFYEIKPTKNDYLLFPQDNIENIAGKIGRATELSGIDVYEKKFQYEFFIPNGKEKYDVLFSFNFRVKSLPKDILLAGVTDMGKLVSQPIVPKHPANIEFYKRPHKKNPFFSLNDLLGKERYTIPVCLYKVKSGKPDGIGYKEWCEPVFDDKRLDKDYPVYAIDIIIHPID